MFNEKVGLNGSISDDKPNQTLNSLETYVFKSVLSPPHVNHCFRYQWSVPFSYTTGVAPNFNATNNDVVWLHDTQKGRLHVQVVKLMYYLCLYIN